MKLLRFSLITFMIVGMAGLWPVHADIVRGRVVDADTKETLPDASVKFNMQIGENGWMVSTCKADSMGVFTFFADGRGTLEVSMLGYYSKKKPVLAFTDSRKDTLDIGDVELKISAQMLKMVEVKGHARRFTVRGDTIVFNPEAFHLQEGARLDELIRQLPGVQVDDEGKLSWNGKPIRLTMDGESLFGGDDLVKKLPAEAVQDIKAYNKASDFAERTGRNDGDEDMVLDLTIKPGFLDRWYGDVKAGYQSPEYYEGELSMNRLSKTDPMMVFADANNIEKQHRRYMNGWSSSWGNGYGNEQGGTAGWQHNWLRKQGEKELKNNYSFTGGLAHDDKWSNQRTETDNYFPDMAASHQNTTTYNRNHALNPSFNANMQWRPDTLTTISVRASANYKRTRSTTRQTTEQEEYAIDGYEPTLSQQTNTHDEGHETTLHTTLQWNRQVTKEGMLGGNLMLSYTDGNTDSWTERTLNDYRDGNLSSLLSQQANMPSKRLTTEAGVHYRFWVTKYWQLFTAYRIANNHNRNSQDFMTDGKTDAANSYDNRYNRDMHNVELNSTFNLSSLQLIPKVNGRWIRESQDYQRGLLDTAAVRHRFVVLPSLKATWKLSKMMSLEANYAFTTQQPELLQTIGYRDLTDPIFITEGNPDLKDSHINDYSLKYNMVLSRQQISLSASVSYRTVDNTTITALSYNPNTGVYTSRPENVKGNQSWAFQLNYDHGLGNMFRLQNDFRLNATRLYGYLTLLPTQTERTLNRQSNLHPSEKLTFSYDKDWLKASVFANIDASRLRFTASSEQNTTLWNNNFGVNFEATVSNFVFASTLTENARRGYAAQSMNRNRLLWDGSVTWKILKNKARVKLEFEDLLNNEDGFESQQSAYQQIFSYSDFRHHYVGLTFTYHLDAKKKD